jgi:hypothetical protein
MPTTIQITTDNYDGQSAVITYYPDTGGTINLGTHILPYDYNTDYYYGTYSLYFPVFDTTCTLVIANQTPTPSATMTPTPTITPTMTPTPTPTLPQQYYVYKGCNRDIVQYIVQTQPGYTIIPGKVIRNGFDYGFPIGIIYFCWEFLYVTNTFPTFPPGTNVTNYTGNFFTIINPGDPISPFNNCTDCLSYVEPPQPTNCNFTIVTNVQLTSINSVTPSTFYGESLLCPSLIGPKFPVSSVIGGSSFVQYGYSGNISVEINTGYGTTPTTLSLIVNNITIQSISIPSLGGGSLTTYTFNGISFLYTDTVKILWQ